MQDNDPWVRGAEISDAELERQQAEIRRGLVRAQTTTGVALALTVLLALGLVFHARRAEHNERMAEAAARQTTEELRKSELARARAWRLSGAVGRRDESLRAIRAAAAIRPGTDLRDEAIAVLALVDIQPGKVKLPISPQANAYAVSPDLNWCAVGGGDGVVTVMSAQNAAVSRHFSLPGQAVASVDFSHDSQLLAARYAGGAVRVWNLADNKLLIEANYRQREERPDSIGFHPTNRELAVACEDQRVRILDLATGMETAAIRTEAAAWTARYDPSGRQLAVGVETWIHVYQSATRIKTHSLNTGERVAGLAWYPDGARLVAFAPYGRLMLVDTRTGGIKILTGHTSRATAVHCDPSARLLLSTSWDGTTRFWDAGSGHQLFSTYAGFARGFDLTGQRIGYYREGIEFGDWEVVRSGVFSSLALPWDAHPMVDAMAFSPDGRWLAACVHDRVLLLDSFTGRLLAATSAARPTGVAFAPNGQSLAVSSEAGIRRVSIRENPLDQTVEWEAPERFPDVPEGYFRGGFACSGHGRLFAAEGQTHIAVVDLVAGRGVGNIRVSRWHTSVTASPDGRWVAGSVWKGGGTTVWELATQRKVAEFNEFGGQAAFSPDSRQLVVGTATDYVFIDTERWEITRQLARESSASAIYGLVAFAPHNRYMAMAHNLRQIRLFRPDSGPAEAVLDAPLPERLRGLAFSPDGQRLAAATDAGLVQIWHLNRISQELSRLGLDGKDHPEEATAMLANALPPSRLGGALTFWMTVMGAGLGMLVITHNLRRQRQLVKNYEVLSQLAVQRRQALDAAQSSLMQSEKMKALGTLAAGIAHDFNNLLSVIRMAGQLVQRELRPGGDSQQNLEDIEQAVIQGKNLTRSILGYSRSPASERQSFHLNEVVSETVAMLSQSFLSGIGLTLELDPALPLWSGDKSRLEQVLLNLIVNANEAMRGQGQLTITTRLITTPKANVLPPQPARQYLELTVRDSGPGISPDILPRIFEPFFTTKQAGTARGTGLGLTSVFTIAQQDGLGLGVETEVGRGTAFYLSLPWEAVTNPG